MADRFHFNPETGRTGKCDAKTQCRFGQSEGEHGGSREEARANYEGTMKGELFSNTQGKAVEAEAAKPQSFADTLREAAEIARQKEAYRTGGAPAATTKAAPAAISGEGFSGGFRLDALRAAQDAEIKRQIAAKNAEANQPSGKSLSGDVPPPRFASPVATPAPQARPTPGKPFARFSGAQLDAEASEFKAESGYSVRDLIGFRQLSEADVVEAERDYDGWVTVKIPSSSEMEISSELVRRELKAASTAPRRW